MLTQAPVGLSRIPHYHAQEATDAIKPILGKYYHEDKRSWTGALYSSFTDCQWVEPGEPVSSAAREAVPQVFCSSFHLHCSSLSSCPPSLKLTGRRYSQLQRNTKGVEKASLRDGDGNDGDNDDGVLWYKPGPMPAPVTVMRPAEIADLLLPSLSRD
jgi:hypothetical protein